MRTKKIIKNFQCRVDYACGSDELRPVMENIYFKDGFLYATDAHIGVRHKLDLHGFDPEEIELMDGKMIHKNVFKEVYKHHFVKAEKDGLFCTTGNIQVKYFWTRTENKFPNLESVLQECLKKTDEKVANIGLNLHLMSKLKNVFTYSNPYGKSCELLFTNQRKGVLCTPASDGFVLDQLGIIMPVVIGESKFLKQ